MFVRVTAGLPLALFLACGPISAQAMTVFDVAWSGAVGVRGALTSSDETLSISGFVQIDANPGDMFQEEDFTLVNLTVSGASIVDFVLTDASAFDLAGMIDASGLFATLSVNPAPFAAGAAGAFGCSALLCADGEVFVTNDTLFGPFATVTYASAGAAAQSFAMTARTSAVPLPATLPLAAAGVAGFGLLRRRARG